MVPLILLLLVAGLAQAQTPAPAPPVRPLTPGAIVRDSMAGGGKAIYSIDIPPDTAARIVVRQEGIDVGVTLRLKGSTTPEHGLNLTGGLEGEETAYPPISSTPATWQVFVNAALPRAARGEYTIVYDLGPADDHARAIAAARAQHQAASDTSWIGDGPAYEKAMAMYAATADAAAAAGDPTIAAEATYQGARQHDVLGDIPGAIELQTRALQMFRALDRRDREARVLNRLGDLSRKVGEVAEADKYFQDALPLAQACGDPATVAEIFNNWGLLLVGVGRIEEGLEKLQSAIPLAQQTNATDTEITLHANSGLAYQDLGLYDKAVASFERALALTEKINQPRRIARTLQMTASAYFDSGDLARAEQTVQKSLDVYERAQDPALAASAQLTYGRILLSMDETDRAIGLFSRALPALRAAKDGRGEAATLTGWAEALLRRGEPDAALEKVDAALPIQRLVMNREGEAHTQYVRALALQMSGRTSDASTAAAESTRIVEGTRGTMINAHLRTSYLATVRKYFALQIDLLQQQGSSAAAFEVSERGRARTLLEGLAESATRIRKGVDPQLLARQRTVQAALNAKEAYRARIVSADGEKNPRAIAAQADIARLIDEWNATEAEIRRNSPEYWALKAPEPITVERLQQTLLDADTALVEYQLGATHSYAWVIDRQSITAYTLPPSARIEPLARQYHTLLSTELTGLDDAARRKLGADSDAAGRKLATAVWAPLAARVRGKRLLIVSDGVLQYVPFAALPSTAGAPLLASHEIAYLPSASVLQTLRHNSRAVAADAPIAVFADPVFSPDDARLTGHTLASRGPASRAGDGYPRLRFSRSEAQAIAAASKGAFEALDFTAAKQTLTTRDLRRYRVLHFATHGVLNTEHPELSGLVLSLIDSAGKPIDGFLRLHEIYNLDLDADLVVLSACRTALGKEVHGEGLIGLTRGFMYAGATRVVSSVWNVDDRASALLMSRFYQGMLTRRLAPAKALREAQLSLLAEPRWANPHYWAAFGLQGDGGR